MTKRKLISPFVFRCMRLAVAPALAALGVSPLWADQVILKNGDRVTGAIVKKDGNSLTISA